jgi:hypothetical protein
VQGLQPGVELAYANAGIEQHLHHEPILAGTGYRHFRSSARPRHGPIVPGFGDARFRLPHRLATVLFNQMPGLADGQTMFAPQLGRLSGGPRVKSSLPAFDRDFPVPGKEMSGTWHDSDYAKKFGVSSFCELYIVFTPSARFFMLWKVSACAMISH